MQPALAAPGDDRPAWLARHDDDTAYQWARQAWDTASAQPDAWFDHRKADRVVENWPRWFKLTSDRFAGVPFRLLDWQEIVVRLLVGWKVPARDLLDPRTGLPLVMHVRLFRCLRLWVPRKNGKSEFLAALALLFFVHERLVGSEGYCFARGEEQARIPWKRMKAMLMQDTALTGGATPRVTMTAKSMLITETGSFFHLLSGRADGKHGRMPQVTLGDEMHEWPSRDLEDNLRQGSGTRLQPIELYASTAGLKSKLVGFQIWEESCAIAEGLVEDPTTLVVIFAAGPEDDWQSETVWKKANPTLGLTPTWDYMRGEARKARGNPRAEATFRRYHLNQWVEQISLWLPLNRWDACALGRLNWKNRLTSLAGRRCFLALDVSERRDFTCLMHLFPPDDPLEPWVFVPRFWLPEVTVAERAERDRRLPYEQWVANGALETTPGEVINQDYMLQAVKNALQQFDVVSIGVDPWNTQKLRTDMEKDGIDPEMVKLLRFGTQTLGEPSKDFEAMVMDGRLDHGGHPVLRWMAGHAAIRFDENMNFVPAKRRSAEKIDGIVAGVMALALAIQPGEADMSDFLRSPLS